MFQYWSFKVRSMLPRPCLRQQHDINVDAKMQFFENAWNLFSLLSCSSIIVKTQRQRLSPPMHFSLSKHCPSSSCPAPPPLPKLPRHLPAHHPAHLRACHCPYRFHSPSARDLLPLACAGEPSSSYCSSFVKVCWAGKHRNRSNRHSG